MPVALCACMHQAQLALCVCACIRHNQELEQDSAAMHEEQRKLEREARSLALRLDAVLKDKFTPRGSFDADTPIDKTLKFLQEVIAVSLCSSIAVGAEVVSGCVSSCRTALRQAFSQHMTRLLRHIF